MFNDINASVAVREEARMVARITGPVRPDLEVAAMTDRVSKALLTGPWRRNVATTPALARRDATWDPIREDWKS